MGAGADFLQLDPTTAPTMGRAAWLAGRIYEAAAAGAFGVGDRLPPTRHLAAELGWSRGVVVEAYQRLAETGLLSARSRSGTRIAIVPPPRPGTAPSASKPEYSATTTNGASGSADLVDLTPGVPDLDLFPRSAWLRAERDVLTTLPASSLRYGHPAGDPDLRRALVGWLATHRGVRTTPEAVVVVAGVAQTLALTAHVLTRAGHDRIAVEDPGSAGARDELAYWGLTPVPVPVDPDGLVVDHLAATGARVVVTTPAHQYPTGVAMAPHRRTELLHWTTQTGALVVEDDYDADQRYDRSPTPALHSTAPDTVLHTGSVSKTLAPGLRLGWAVIPEHLRPAFLEAKHASDITSPALAQLTLARLLTDGTYDRHLRRTRRHHRTRRDALAQALEAATTHLPGVRVSGIAAGLHLLLELPDHDDHAVAHALLHHGVLVDPLSRHRTRTGPGGLVLGYAAHPPHRLEAAATTIGHVVRISGHLAHDDRP